MKAAERSQQFMLHLNEAREFYANGMEENCWYSLLLAAEVNWTSSTPRQREQRKQAARLWQLTGAIANIKHLQGWWTDLPPGVPSLLGAALEHLQEVDTRLRNTLKLISKRIAK